MDRFISALTSLGEPAGKTGGDSFVDRLNCKHSVFILVIFSILVTTRHYVGEPISCWCPSHFTDSHVEYTNHVCWVTNTYYLPHDDPIPDDQEPKKFIGYYQWVSLILIGQAVLFYIPHVVWLLFNTKAGIAVTTITDASIKCQNASSAEDRDKIVRYMTKHMGRYLAELSRKHLMATNCPKLWWAFYGNFLSVFYLFVKIMYLVNVVGQLFLLNAFLETEFHLYGIQVLEKLFRGEDWRAPEKFPRVTMCDFKIRVLGNLHRYSVQCALPINLFNEKIYIFIWFWYVFVATATAGSLVVWTFRICVRSRQARYIKTRLIAMDRLQGAGHSTVTAFCQSFLRRDGYLIVMLVSKNASDIVAAELICGLFEHYRTNRQSILRLRSVEQNILREYNPPPDEQPRPSSASADAAAESGMRCREVSSKH